jgi:hypothetical protein
MGQTFVEVVLEGPRGRARGFVEGYLAGRGVEARLLDAEEEGFERETLREHLREVLHPGAEVLHLLVPAGALEEVREAAETAAGRGIGLAIRKIRPLVGASVAFTLEGFSPEHGRRVLALLADLPEGVALRRERPFEERLDPDARGIEAYSPAHEYELRGKGTVEGDLEGVLSVHRRLREESAVRLGRAELIPIEP